MAFTLLQLKTYKVQFQPENDAKKLPKNFAYD